MVTWEFFKIEGPRECEEALREAPKATAKNVLKRTVLKAGLPLLAAGAAEAWLFLRSVGLEDLPPRMMGLLAAACIAPAVGLLIWLATGARSAIANFLLILAALCGGASAAVVWLVLQASAF